jgi:hypothetical protein
MPSTPRSRKLLDPRTRRKLVAELRAGPTRRKALERLHISESTFYRELERSAELRELVNGNGKQKGGGHRNGDGGLMRSKSNEEGRKGGESRRERATQADRRAAAEEPAAPAPRFPDAGSATTADAPAAPIATAEELLAVPVEPRPGKSRKAPKRSRALKPADGVDQKAEPSLAATAAPEPERQHVRKRTPRAASLAPIQTLEAAASVAAPATAPKAPDPEVAPTEDRPGAAQPMAELHTVTALAPTAARVTAARVTAVRAALAAERQPAAAGSRQAYWLPPVLVLALEIIVGLVVGASPVVLLLVIGSMVAVLYVVRRWGSHPAAASRPTQRTATDREATNVEAAVPGAPHVAPMAVPAVGLQPTPLPIRNRLPVSRRSAGNDRADLPGDGTSAPSAEQEPTPLFEPRRNDLRWLWNSIGRDPRPPRPPRHDGR